MPNNRHDVGGSLGGPIVKDKIFFFGSWAPRYVRRSNDYLFTRSETDTINQSQTYNSAFGKVNYDPTNRLRTGFSVLWTPTSSTGTLPAYNDSIANSISSSKASNQIQKTRGFESPQRSYAGTLDYTLTNTSLISVRAGPLRRQLQGHRRPDVQQRDLPVLADRARLSDSGRPARRRRLPEHARASSSRTSITRSAAT